jgi:hypothetical protein
MRKARRPQSVEEFPELDRLVLTEIRSMVGSTLKEAPSRKQDFEEEQDFEDRTFTSDRRRPDRERARTKPKRVREERRRSREEDEVAWESPQDPGQSAAGDLLQPDERQFVAHAVEWLRGRTNRDMILANIWSGVIDADPDSFYSAPIPERPESPETVEGGNGTQEAVPEAENPSEHGS